MSGKCLILSEFLFRVADAACECHKLVDICLLRREFQSALQQLLLAQERGEVVEYALQTEVGATSHHTAIDNVESLGGEGERNLGYLNRHRLALYKQGGVVVVYIVYRNLARRVETEQGILLLVVDNHCRQHLNVAQRCGVVGAECCIQCRVVVVECYHGASRLVGVGTHCYRNTQIITY